MKKYVLLSAMLLLFPLALMLTARLMKHNFKTLPYFAATPEGPEARFTPESGRQVTFTDLVNHDGRQLSSSDMENSVYLAFFFSPRSPMVAKITRRLLYALYKYPDEQNIRFVCFNTEPDSVSQAELHAYMAEVKAQPDKWYFLTGSAAVSDSLFRHAFLMRDYKESARIRLVDTKGYIRGHYNANREQEIERAIEDLALLKKEMRVAASNKRKEK